MAGSPKTTRTNASVTAFLDSVEDETRRADAKAVLKLMKEATGEKPAMWGASIVGFGSYKSNTGDWPIVGFSPRKANLVLYIMPGFAQYDALLAKLGKHKTGTSCLYIGKMADIDQDALRELIARSVARMKEKYG
jgi:hypothetical protein